MQSHQNKTWIFFCVKGLVRYSFTQNHLIMICDKSGQILASGSVEKVKNCEKVTEDKWTKKVIKKS